MYVLVYIQYIHFCCHIQVAHVEPSQLTTSVQGVVLILISHLRQMVNSTNQEQDGNLALDIMLCVLQSNSCVSATNYFCVRRIGRFVFPCDIRNGTNFPSILYTHTCMCRQPIILMTLYLYQHPVPLHLFVFLPLNHK